MEKYVYEPLSSYNAMRVLVVEPAQTVDAPLSCSLKEVPLLHDSNSERSMVYDALSYVWGAVAGDRPLLCDGRTLLVTANCECALQHLRDKENKLVIWIDAVCINQESNSEKSFQVMMMRFIYDQAQRVYIWLGEGVEETAEMFRALNSLGHWTALLPNRVLKMLAPRLGIHRHREEFTKLAQHTWWERVWTLQEFLYTNQAIFVSGWDRCTESKIRFVHRWYRSSSTTIEQVNKLEKMQQRFKSMEYIERRRFGSRNQISRSPQWFQSRFLQTADETISTILISTWNNRATEPKDQIYAKLPLIEFMLSPDRADFEFMEINYEKPVAKVFEEFTRRYMELFGTVSLLHEVPRSTPRMDGLPSWVPDYSGILERPDTMSLVQRNKDGILAHVPTIQTSGPGQLILKGEIMGTIGSVGPIYPIVPYGRSDFSLAEVWDKYILEVAEYLMTLTPPGKVEDLLIVEELCRPQGLRNRFKHRLFITLQRHIGVARGDIQEGDVAVYLLGGEDVFILRKQGNEYEFVGTAVMQRMKIPRVQFKDKTVDELDTFILI